MGRLIAIALLTALMITSNSIAQSSEGLEPVLLAKAETNELSISKIANASEKIRANIESESIKNGYSEVDYSYNRVNQASGALDTGDGSRDISFEIKNQLNLEKNLDLKYQSPRLRAEQLPLVMSSKNKKTKGVVFPPFLYLKKQF